MAPGELMRFKSRYRNMDHAKAEQMRELYFKDRFKQREIAAMFDVTQGTVSRVISGHSWGVQNAL